MKDKEEFDSHWITYSDGYCDKCKVPFFNELLISEFDNYSCWECGK